jgi:hypothetical protein
MAIVGPKVSSVIAMESSAALRKITGSTKGAFTEFEPPIITSGAARNRIINMRLNYRYLLLALWLGHICQTQEHQDEFLGYFHHFFNELIGNSFVNVDAFCANTCLTCIGES